MKYTIVLLTSLFTALTAHADIPENMFVDRGYDHTGAWVEELVELPNGVSPAEYASALSEDPPIAIGRTTPRNPEQYTVIPWESGAAFVVSIDLGISRPEPDSVPLVDIRHMVAGDDENVVAPQQQEPGFWSRRASAVRESFVHRPVMSTLATAGGAYGLYWLYSELRDSGGSGDGGNVVPTNSTANQSSTEGMESPSIVIQGDGNSVTVHQDRSVTTLPAPSPAEAPE